MENQIPMPSWFIVLSTICTGFIIGGLIFAVFYLLLKNLNKNGK